MTALNAISITFNTYLGNEVSCTKQHIVTQGVTQGMFICCFFTFPVLKYIRKKQLQKLHMLTVKGADKKTIFYQMGWKSSFSFSCALFYCIAVLSIVIVDIGVQYISNIEPFFWFVLIKFVF